MEPMRILIISDTHKKEDNFFRLMRRMKPLDLLIHCGDSESSEAFYRERAHCPVQIVAGNNDFFSALPREKEFPLGNYRVWLTHGHMYYVSMTYDVLRDEALSRGIDIVMCGHTHRPVIRREEGLTILNPGSLSYPRQEGRHPSYILMEIDRKGEAHYHLNYL